MTGSTLSFPTNPAAGQVIEVTSFGAVDLTGNIGEVQYNAGGAFGSSNTFTFNSGTNTLSVTNLTATGNLTSQGGYVYVDTALIAVSSGNAGIFNTGVNNINLGLAANVTIGSASGNSTVRGNLISNSSLGRSKYRYRKPCQIFEFIEDIHPGDDSNDTVTFFIDEITQLWNQLNFALFQLSPL